MAKRSSVRKRSITAHRKEYSGKRSRSAKDPIRQFLNWYRNAERSEIYEPNAAALATVGPSGTPSVRMVLIKIIDEHGFVFFTDYRSRKGLEIATNPKAAIAVYWDRLERQVRIVGRVRKISREESASYFASRPLGAQVSATISKQSSVLTNRDALEREWIALSKKFRGKPLPLPAHWGGYRIVPEEIEFWQGAANRLHHRFRYRKVKGRWKVEELFP